MSVIWLQLLLIQVSFNLAAKAALQLQRLPTKIPETTNLNIVQARSVSLTNVDNEISLDFASPGNPIPKDELRHTLSAASAHAQAYLPRFAHDRISNDAFETNITFPQTGDNIYLWVFSYGFGLTWQQLSQALFKVQVYMLGIGPGHPVAHSQELEFHVQLATAMDVARGGVKFTPGTRAPAKRNTITPTLSLTQANLSSSPGNSDLPIWFEIGGSLFLNITEIGGPIPEQTVLRALDGAWKDIVLNHDDIDATVPRNLFPYAFQAMSGKPPQIFTTQISITQVPSKKIKMSWSLLCLTYHGLELFMSELKHFNELKFELFDLRKGKLADGDVRYWANDKTAPMAGLDSQ